MPYNTSYRRGPRYGSRSGRQRRAPGARYGFIWLTALGIFALVLALSRSGLGARLEQAVALAARDDGLARGVIGFVLPEPPAAAPAETEPPRMEDNIFQPEIPEQPLSPDELPGAPPPELEVFESVLPELPAAVPSAPHTANVASLTIDGETGGYEGSGTVYLRNETKYEINAAALLKNKSPVKLSGTGVQVLIMHTHGTEAYTPDAAHQYEESDPSRTTDPERNVLRVGEEIAAILEQNGISVVHSTELNDYPAYNGSYNRALKDIEKYLKDNPSIKVVIDVHRDAMISQNGTVYKTVAEIDGRQAAQLMFVAGTDQGGLSHDKWRENLTFQLKLQDRMNTKYPGIMRPVNIRTGRFNQHVTTGSMLLEVGTSGNSLSEALYSAQLFAQELADFLNGK